MKLLKELADIVTRQRVEKVKLIDISLEDEPGSQYGKFYQALHSGEIKTDNDAAKLFYDSNSLDDRYRKLKSRFKKRLLNYLFFLDTNSNSFSNYSQAYHTCQKNLILCHILSNQSANYAFRKLAQQTLRNAQKYDFHDVITQITSDMLTDFSLSGRAKDYKETLPIFQSSQAILQLEYEANRLSEQLILHFSISNKVDEELERLTENNFKRIQEIVEKHDSYKLRYQYFYIGGLYYQVKNDLHGLIGLCDDLEDYFDKNKKFLQPAVVGQFTLMKLPALLNTRQHTKGLESINTNLQYLAEGSNNWILTMEFYFLICMQLAKYEDAAQVFLKVVNHPRFKRLSEYRREKWRIFHAYLNYIFDVENLDKELLENKYIRGFNVVQFLSNTPIASKDKTGLNIAILVLQVQYLFKEQESTQVFNKTDALSMYAYRYINKKENSRAYLFIKMLLSAEKKGFVYRNVVPATEKLFQKLKTETDGQSAEWEILPYETLWKQALQFMKTEDMSASSV